MGGNYHESTEIRSDMAAASVSHRKFFSQTIANDVQRIEYKPLFITQLLEMTPDRDQNELQEMNR